MNDVNHVKYVKVEGNNPYECTEDTEHRTQNTGHRVSSESTVVFEKQRNVTCDKKASGRLRLLTS